MIDIPDERAGFRWAFDHMHAWLATEDEARTMAQMLVDLLGSEHHHEVVDMDIEGARCPRCHQKLKFFLGQTHEVK